MVLNLSRGGLFVQTTAAARPGQPVRIRLSVDGEPIPVAADVRWKRIVAPHLRTVETGGIGLRIHDAPEPYYQYLAAVADGTSQLVPAVAATPQPEAPSSPRLPFRVRVKQARGPRSRFVRVEAHDAEGAAQAALARMGTDWTVLEIEEG